MFVFCLSGWSKGKASEQTMPFRRIKIYDAEGRLLYESTDQRETLSESYAKAEQFGTPAGCKAEHLDGSKWEVTWGRLLDFHVLTAILFWAACIAVLVMDIILLFTS